MAEANERLRVARRRTASLTHPGGCLTRQELAELVNTWVWEHHDKKVEATANYVGKLEQGVIRWPGTLYREAFRAIFGVSTDSALGFVNARSRRAAVKLDNVKRKQFIHSATTLGVGAFALGELLVALPEGSEPTPIPARVGATEIEQIHAATEVFESWSRTYGGGLVRDAVMGQLRWSAGLLEATCPDRLRPELFSAVGDLADMAGCMAYDAGAQGEAHRVHRFALACAERAKDWPLRAEVLSSMAKQAIWTGQPDDGLTLAEQALVRADRLTATGRAMLHTDRARALAKMRRVEETLTAIGTADEHFAHSIPADDPPCMAYYNDTRHIQLTGRSLFDLAVLGRNPAEATDRLTAAVAGNTDGYARSRAISLTALASLTMATGDPLQAAALGHEALDVAGTLRSRRVTEDLRELAHYAAAHQHLDEVAHLRHRIKTLVCADRPWGGWKSSP
ncbi:MAG: XRE family transcriptional regulator [Pseudonocardiales bacterium]|nr:XRE family transcriptional regulator [Pseudonocardiales bacterium]MBV9031623.1 XRE family transcriptional regulator [Pseudonocardiales bacterium]MBW0010398.1 XRE family transcriptional regulator [Pseudonocardiales bacterium]